VGLPSDRVDVFADGIDANQIGTASNRVSNLYGQTVDASSVNADSLTILGDAALKSTDISTKSTGFDSWTQISSDRPGAVIASAKTDTDGSSNAIVILDIDLTGDSSADISHRISVAPDGLGSGQTSDATAGHDIPAGGQYKIRNQSDPNNGNVIRQVSEVTR